MTKAHKITETKNWILKKLIQNIRKYYNNYFFLAFFIFKW